MKSKHHSITSAILISLTLLAAWSTAAMAKAPAAELPVVHAVLFFSPSCGHCEYVRTEVFPPLYEKYGDQLDILEIDTSTQDGSLLFNKVLDMFSVPANYRGVPFLVIEENYLVGSLEIPEQFPDLVAAELKGDGTAWPKIPGLETFIAAMDAQDQDAEEVTQADNTGSVIAAENQTDVETPQISTIESPNISNTADSSGDTPIYIERFMQDIAGNSISVAVLLGMVGTVIYTGIVFMRAEELNLWPWWLIPVLIAIGIFVAAYLSFVEVSGSEAICGPVGDCNAVQNSPYATLFGFLHVGVLGIIGYILIGAFWAFGRWGSLEWRGLANMVIFLLSVFGVLFSTYLTFLEPFVIGATCMWCITSAVVMTLLLLNTTPLALRSWVGYDDQEDLE